MTFSYFLLLIPYGLFFLAFAVFTFINIFNLIKYGGVDIAGSLTTFIFCAGIIIILFATYQNLSGFDWNQTITISTGKNILPNSF